MAVISPSFRLSALLSAAAHLALLAGLSWLRYHGPRGAAAEARLPLVAVRVLPAEATSVEPAIADAPPQPQRVGEARHAWTPREAAVAAARVVDASPRPQRQPSQADRLEVAPRAVGTGGPPARHHPQTTRELFAATPAPTAAARGVASAAVAAPEVPEDTPAVSPYDATAGSELVPSKVISFEKVYPAHSREQGEEGTVVVDVEVNEDGSPGRVTVVVSSGHPSLDSGAVESLRKARFAPATRRGKPVATLKRMSIVYQLRDPDGSR